jgi:hypothetical protein
VVQVFAPVNFTPGDINAVVWAAFGTYNGGHGDLDRLLRARPVRRRLHDGFLPDLHVRAARRGAGDLGSATH